MFQKELFETISEDWLNLQKNSVEKDYQQNFLKNYGFEPF